MPIYQAIYSGPPLHYGNTKTAKRYVAIHNTSNDATAEAEASYAKRRDDSVSSHYYVDADSIVQSLNTDLRAYHAGSSTGNSQAVSYEITGTNSKSRSWWLANVAWPLLARQIALDCRVHGITPRLLTVDQIKAGQLTGIITHDQMRQAWGGTTHTDPGANFPLDYLLQLVQAELEDDMTIGKEDVVTIAKGVWSASALEYEDENGNTIRDPRTPKDILYAAHAAALRAEEGVKKLLAQEPGTPGEPADLEVLVRRVVREELDKTVARLGAAPTT